MSEDRQLRAIHLILDFQPLSYKFQDVGHAIRADDPWLPQIDISVLGFLAREDIMLVELLAHRFPREKVILREETASSRLSLNAEINQFHLEEEGEEQGEPVIQVSDSKDKPDRFSGVRTSDLVIARKDNSSEEEEEKMALNKKKGLHEILADRAKGPTPKDTPGSQPLLALPPSSFYN